MASRWCLDIIIICVMFAISIMIKVTEGEVGVDVAEIW